MQGVSADPKLAGQTRRRSSRAARGDVKHNDVVSGCRRVVARRDAHTDQNAFAPPFVLIRNKEHATGGTKQRTSEGSPLAIKAMA